MQIQFLFTIQLLTIRYAMIARVHESMQRLMEGLVDGAIPAITGITGIENIDAMAIDVQSLRDRELADNRYAVDWIQFKWRTNSRVYTMSENTEKV